MAVSNWHQRFTIHSAEIASSALPNLLDELNETLKNTKPFTCLMADYWNDLGNFSDYGVGCQELTGHIANCMGGSAFGEVAEVQWRKIGNVFRVVLVGEADLGHLPSPGAGAIWCLEDGQMERARRGNDRCRRPLLLWGSKRLGDGIWVEARIPRRLIYPTMPEQHADYDHVRLHFIEYRDERGRVIVHRRTHLSAHLKPSLSSQKPEEKREQSHDQTIE